MKSLAHVSIAFGLLIGVAIPTSADHGCNGVVTQVDTPAGTFYLDDRTNGAITINHWLYLESNEVAGLQSGGSSITFGDVDPCAHENPD
ncbi:MAG: hypothetical protein ACREN5_15200, partial [Gemmatimonadales bacterium]